MIKRIVMGIISILLLFSSCGDKGDGSRLQDKGFVREQDSNVYKYIPGESHFTVLHTSKGTTTDPPEKIEIELDEEGLLSFRNLKGDDEGEYHVITESSVQLSLGEIETIFNGLLNDNDFFALVLDGDGTENMDDGAHNYLRVTFNEKTYSVGGYGSHADTEFNLVTAPFYDLVDEKLFSNN